VGGVLLAFTGIKIDIGVNAEADVREDVIKNSVFLVSSVFQFVLE
jgi:hypothetical protein